MQCSWTNKKLNKRQYRNNRPDKWLFYLQNIQILKGKMFIALLLCLAKPQSLKARCLNSPWTAQIQGIWFEGTRCPRHQMMKTWQEDVQKLLHVSWRPPKRAETWRRRKRGSRRAALDSLACTHLVPTLLWSITDARCNFCGWNERLEFSCFLAPVFF